jgi:hypothetical protein
MNVAIDQNQWASYFEDFNRRNRWRSSKLLAVTEAGESGTKASMPLVGVSLEPDREGAMRIHIMLGGHGAMAPRHQTFTISGVRRVAQECGDDGKVNSLEIEDAQGETSRLRFEPTIALSPVN